MHAALRALVADGAVYTLNNGQHYFAANTHRPQLAVTNPALPYHMATTVPAPVKRYAAHKHTHSHMCVYSTAAAECQTGESVVNAPCVRRPVVHTGQDTATLPSQQHRQRESTTKATTVSTTTHKDQRDKGKQRRPASILHKRTRPCLLIYKHQLFTNRPVSF
jgi:mRNA-degrading endonuclease toxin of MazEF toxin-antitoxin module